MIDNDPFDYVRVRLTELKAAIGEVDVVPGYFIGDEAGERAFADSVRSGQLSLRAAGQNAKHGLDALDRGDRELANLHLRQAEQFAAASVEAQLNLHVAEKFNRARKKRENAVALNRDRRDAAADRLFLVRQEYRSGDTAELLRRRIMKKHGENFPRRTLQRDIKKIRDSRK